MTANHAHTPPECEHHWNSHLQPKNVGLRWIKQCSHCGDFDTDNLREQVAAAKQRGAEAALTDFRRFATRVMPPTVTRKDVITDIEVALKRLSQDRYLLMGPLRADLLEGDDE